MTDQEIQDLLEQVRQDEEPCEEPCYQSCSAATNPKALENLGKVLRQVRVKPDYACSTRNGTVMVHWLTAESRSDGVGHHIGGQEFMFDIGPDESGKDYHSACLWQQGKEKATDGYSLWNSNNWDDILNKLMEFCS